MSHFFKNLIVIFLQTCVGQAAVESKVTVSGISSGAFMAAQLGVIYSDEISGVGTVAGGFYGCAGNHFQQMHQLSKVNFMNDKALFLLNVFNPFYKAVQSCGVSAETTNLDVKLLRQYAAQKLIADTENIKNQKFYIFQGSKDQVVHPKMQMQLQDFYLQMKVPPENIQLSSLPSAHTFPTDQDNLNSCTEQAVPYISSCHKNVAGEILNFLVALDLLRSKMSEPRIYRVNQNMENHPVTISDYGYLLTNQQCLEAPQSCHLHVVLHGCEMNDSFDGAFDQKFQRTVFTDGPLNLTGVYRMRSEYDPLSPFSPSISERNDQMGLLTFVLRSGFSDYVEKNNLMILFPQTQISQSSYPYNPKGCWDWVGTSGEKYLTNQGPETSWLMQLIRSVRKNPKKLILN